MATLNPATGRFRLPARRREAAGGPVSCGGTTPHTPRRNSPARLPPLRWSSAQGPGPDPVRAAVAPLLAAHRAARPDGALLGSAEAELLRGYAVAERLHRGQL